MTPIDLPKLNAKLEREYPPWVAEVVRNLAHTTCAQCGAPYYEPPCDLVDHIEAHEALEQATRA